MTTQTVQLGPGGRPAKLRYDLERVQLKVRVTPELKRELVTNALRNGRRLSAEVVAALEAAVAV